MKKEIFWKREIEEIKKTGFLDNNTTISDALIKNFYTNTLNAEDKILINLMLSKKPQQKDLENLLKIWDIEIKHETKSLILSYILKNNPSLRATKYEEPRLKGLFLNQRFKNLQILTHFKKITQELNNQKIKPLMLNNGLMKFICPNFPRYINDIDLLIEDKNWIKSAKIIKKLGYIFKKLNNQTFVIYENKNTNHGILDIHKNILTDIENHKKLTKNILKRAKVKKFYSTEILTPSYEDFLFIKLISISNNIRSNMNSPDLIYKIADCKFLIENKTNFKWKILIQNTKLTGTEIEINLAIKFINKISQDIIPKAIEQSILFEKKVYEYSRATIFKNYYYKDLQKECRQLKIYNAIKKPKLLKNYIFLKTKYKLLRLLDNHPKLIKLFIKDFRKI